ncbi:hypothetical protein [Paraburkholderia solisilvae]|uniref:hypothetical protein n=1 Tax=Paraburkholderia solisilvae TaxID=624376 RepID=UPI0015826A25|nr:hypothetical protein [Paraburkholderia solisilvae]
MLRREQRTPTGDQRIRSHPWCTTRARSHERGASNASPDRHAPDTKRDTRLITKLTTIAPPRANAASDQMFQTRHASCFDHRLVYFCTIRVPFTMLESASDLPSTDTMREAHTHGIVEQRIEPSTRRTRTDNR